MDWDKIEQLLTVVDKSLAHGTKLQGITNAALAELAKHNEESKPKPERPRVMKADSVPEPEPETETASIRRREVAEETA